MLRQDGKWYKPVGTTATTHILKPQMGRLPNGIDLSNSVENEFFCLKLILALGIPAATVEMTDFGGRRTLIVECFDRRKDFPEQLTSSIRTAALHRTSLIAEA